MPRLFSGPSSATAASLGLVNGPLSVVRRFASSTTTAGTTAPPPLPDSAITDANRMTLRLHGSVTAFKHRRGYGFVLAEGYTKRSMDLMAAQREAAAVQTEEEKDASPSDDAATKTEEAGPGSDFFFTRLALGGGFYVNEGDRVSFRVKRVSGDPAQQDGATHRYVSRSEGYVSTPYVEDTSAPSKRRQGHKFTAIGFRRYNSVNGEEERILPVGISGVMQRWDSTAGTGLIAELDVEGKHHAEAPTFVVNLEDVDLSPVPNAPDGYMAEGRYVKFCLSPSADENEQQVPHGVEPRAYRVIVDLAAERRHGVHRPPTTRRKSFHSGSTAVPSGPRLRGIVRELVERKYGFVLDDSTGESIFFHLSEVDPVVGADHPIRIGDCISYQLMEIAAGRHTGKKHCLRIRLAADDPELKASEAVPSSEEPHSTQRSRAPGTSKGEKKKHSSPTEALLDEFDLLD